MTDHGLAATATAWMDQWFDPEVGLLWNPPGSFDDEGVAPLSVHLVPQSGWYSAALLMREGDGDADRARQVIETLCDIQYDEPGTVWHGTFRRFFETRQPRPGARIWVDYDPNWRQFIGTTFELLLRWFPGRVPEDRIRDAIRLAVHGETDGRVTASYSNIAVMKAWLDVENGHNDRGEAMAEEVVDGFLRHGAFEEYNSPTYYGVVLYALALWRSESSSPKLRAWGAELEEALWLDIGRHWHAGLGNMVGPYTRAYGMDMTTYAAHGATWVWAGLGRAVTPFPDIGEPFDHCHDLCFGPLAEKLGAVIPDAVADELRAFSGERLVRQVIADDPLRVATSWLAGGVMIGAESSPHNWRGWGQYVPATIHWRRPDGAIGWLRVWHAGVIDATAEPGRLLVDCQADAPIELRSNTDLPFETTLDGPRSFVIEADATGPTRLS
ncbi:MAG: hypothetical protein ACR2H3_15310 [Acidimicrobiales bacterium]